MRIRLLTLLLLGWCLSACTPAVKTASLSGDAFLSQAQRNVALKEWAWQGKAGIRSPEKSGTISVDWLQRDDLYLKLVAPFGQGQAELWSSDQGARLLVNGNQLYQANHPDQLLEEYIGQVLPITAMAYWLRGMPQPDMPISNLSASDAVGFVQQGWLVEYLAWGQQERYWLPSKMTISRPGFVEVKLLIRTWKIASDE